MATPGTSRQRFDSMRSQASTNTAAWPRPPSPSYSTTTTGSRVNMPANHALITRKDLRQSIACFEDLMAAAKAYRNALLAMSSASAAFAVAMEACSRVKGCRNANSALAGAGGLQFLVSNHEQLLADTVYRQFEIPLLEALDHYKLVTADRLVAYEKSLHEQSAKLRKTEAENLRVGRRKKRDLQSFRSALAELQRQVDELDAIKAMYHEEVLEGEDEIWDTVLSKIAFVVRSQLDFYEKLAGKVSDPILEPLVLSIPDPFDSYGPPKEDGQIFSVLAPLGMLDSPSSPNPNLSRTSSMPPTPGRRSPSKSVPFPVAGTSPSKAETSTISALGISSPSEDDRAKRELSVIDERASEIHLREDEIPPRDEDGEGEGDGDGDGDEQEVAAGLEDETSVDRSTHTSDTSVASSPKEETRHRRIASGVSQSLSVGGGSDVTS